MEGTIILKQSSEQYDLAMSTKAKSSDDTKAVSPNPPKLHEVMKLAEGLPKGIKLACKKSRQIGGHYYVPSHKNYVGHTNLSNCIIDNGCDNNLFAVDSDGHLDEIFASYPSSDYHFNLISSQDTKSGLSMFVVRYLGRKNFSVRLAVDMFDDAVCDITTLRFHLSTDCAKRILSTPALLSRFDKADYEELCFVAERNVPRRPFSLLGNLTLDCFDIIKVGYPESVLFLVDYYEVDHPALLELAEDVHAALGKIDKEMMKALGVYDPLVNVDPSADF